ncbi:MAG: DUF2764 family protein [Pirellulales bacterium]|jgi:hypothetical protein|nr:DUF2764 family protein [Thermoguttaceae bacterium]MDD4787992.1 DUF2764 family protein [Pirellulales bacterium]MDI9444673.1 DUF2764 family protein [Planctomycetota bacterium]NLZ02315.1 DUF2764 family protein [Pirellulaceae bacterium]
MRIARHFYITTLPALGELGGAVPMGLADLIEHVGEHRQLREQVEAVVLLDDLMQRESLLAGEVEEVEPAVLSQQQARGEAPLPEALAPPPGGEPAASLEADRLWEAYFRYAHELGRAKGSRFLVEWVGFEVALRNTLATVRARRLGLEERGYLVAADLGAAGEDLSAALSEWEAALTPLAGLRAVIRARWAWIERHDAWFSFAVDEMLAYAARVMLLEQWRRTEENKEASSA